jgi:DNA-binding NtrC family response regulator
VRLFADRFAIAPDGHAIDLATGGVVSIVTSPAGGIAEQTRWTLDCDGAFAFVPRGSRRLVDYGRVAEGLRFEAWSGDVRHACAHTPLTLDDCDCAVAGGREVEALKEIFGAPAERPRFLSIWSSDRLRVQAAVSELCRAARVHGIVPISLALTAATTVDTLDARTWCVVGDPDDEGWPSVLSALLRNPKPHVILFAGAREVQGVHGVSLAPAPVDELRESVRPAPTDEHLRNTVDAAAAKAGGSYERFCAALWRGAPESSREDSAAPARRVAERGGEYGSSGATSAATIVPIGQCWPAPAEVAALSQKLDAAVERLEHGRWAAGDRTARQVIGSLARRHEWGTAARGATALADALVRRGRASEAIAVLGEAREYLGRAPGESHDRDILSRVAVVTGAAWTDMADLEKALAILHTVAVAPAADPADARARLALARCLFWRGSYEEACVVLTPLVEESAVPPQPFNISARALLSRALIALDDPARAVRTAVGALADATAVGVPAVTSEAAAAAALAHLAVGDLASVERDINACVGCARAAHNPVLAIKGRLIEAEACRRHGRAAMATALIARMQRLTAASVPPIVRARVDLLRDLLDAADPPAAVEQRVAASGLAGLAVFAPRLPEARGRMPACLGDTLEILSCCQSADDDEAVLGRVCAIVRRQLGAVAAGFYLGEAGTGIRPELVVCDGRVDPALAERVIAASQPIVPHPVNERIEGGAAVRYAGRGIGALVTRWTPAARLDREKSEAVLALAAAAAAPALAAARARRTPVKADEDFIGASEEMNGVRRAVERAASAPFAVLIQGESGSGKELVARAMHRRSTRRARAFCSLNCAALPEDLIESELFGHARGAFTGALSERAGVFEEAHGGTLFLDEVGELSPRAQAKLLRAIQEGEIRRVGENTARHVDVRIIAATNRDLKQECAVHRFRLDLLYRLDVIHIELPPLRDRRDDIAPLVEKYWRDACQRVGSKATLSAAASTALARYDWPGNVRELQNVLAALAVAAARRGVVPPTALPPMFMSGLASASLQLDAARRTFEERFVRAALVRSGGHRVRAAQELGLSRQGLTKLMTRLGISER